ncbi:class I SAM-dependent methyltransferase [Micromonospora sp. NPDC005553]|uniref:class I SAM-dependent methyltransferase n=1 Tax=unclassified Micromonospora TaxID=2617518 RepID=UPI0033AA1093
MTIETTDTRPDQLADLADFYRSRSGDDVSLFDIWETGGARGDSVTPSTHSPAYRTWMLELLNGELTRAGSRRLVSLGSGNAVVEGHLAAAGVEVLAVDAMAEAVTMSTAKGVRSIEADVTTWTPTDPWPVAYLDGLLGHLYDARTATLPIMAHVRSWLGVDGRGILVASNDATRDGSRVQAAPGVTGFHWLAVDYLREQAQLAGFDDVSVDSYVYRRPLSGDRVRSVIIARFGY